MIVADFRENNTAIIFSHVTEIPVSPDQSYIGSAINSLKDKIYNCNNEAIRIAALFTFLPKEMTATYCGTALSPLPGGLLIHDGTF